MPTHGRRRTGVPAARAVWLTTAACLLTAAAAHAGETWPQFRGPTGQGDAGSQPAPTVWSETGNVAWKTTIPGRGHSSPVVDDRHVWVTTAAHDGRDLGAVGVDRATGEVVHSLIVFRPAKREDVHIDNTFASPTPVLRDGRLYIDFGTYGIACLDTSTGEVLWRNELMCIDHQGGPGSSPVLCGGILIVQRDGADFQYVAGLDAATGDVVWKRKRSSPQRDNPVVRRAFSTPLVIDDGGRKVLLTSAADQAHAYDPATGEELWHFRYLGFSNVPSPVAANGLAYFCTGYYSPTLVAMRLGGAGDVTRSHLAWRYKSQVPEVPSPIVLNGRIYFTSNKGVLTCLDALTGEKKYCKRLGGAYAASPVAAGGLLYFCGRDGTTRVVPAGDEFAVLSTNAVEGGIMASPAVVDGAIYLRTTSALYRIEEPRE